MLCLSSIQKWTLPMKIEFLNPERTLARLTKGWFRKQVAVVRFTHDRHYYRGFIDEYARRECTRWVYEGTDVTCTDSPQGVRGSHQTNQERKRDPRRGGGERGAVSSRSPSSGREEAMGRQEGLDERPAGGQDSAMIDSEVLNPRPGFCPRCWQDAVSECTCTELELDEWLHSVLERWYELEEV